MSTGLVLSAFNCHLVLSYHIRNQHSHIRSRIPTYLLLTWPIAMHVYILSVESHVPIAACKCKIFSTNIYLMVYMVIGVNVSEWGS